jgi:integrase
MPSKRLTEEGVRRLKLPPAGKQIDYFDAGMPGLVLRVNYGGRKTWRALYYVKGTGRDGKRRTEPRTYPLGLYPHLNVKQAREKARVFHADPFKAIAQADNGSFKEIAQSFVKRHVEVNGLRSHGEIVRCLAKYVYPQWEHRPFRSLKRADVAGLLDKIEDENGARQADVVLAVIRKMMNWYATRNDDYVSPIVRNMGRYNSVDRKGKRTLSDDEIRAFFSASDEMGGFGRCLQLLLLTGQRLRKVATMQWSDIIDREWLIGTEQREKGNAGSLRLPQRALNIIAAQPRIAENPFVFAADRGQGPFNSFGQKKTALDKKLLSVIPDMRKWVIHDLRRTARSLMSRAGVAPHVAERVLGHAIPGVEGIYDRHSYRDEKAEALKLLSHQIDRILIPETNVIYFRAEQP